MEDIMLTPTHIAHRRGRRVGLARAVAAAAIVATAAGATAAGAAAPHDVAARPLFDPGPTWAPDHGMLCEILERYDAADEHICPTEPISTTSGPR
jgi:hypothetical protein